MPRKKKTVKTKAVSKKKSSKPKRPRFEDCISVIDTEIIKRRSKWNLTILAWMDFEDVSQILRIHIYKKWEMYDPSKPLGHWINRIIPTKSKSNKKQLR